MDKQKREANFCYFFNNKEDLQNKYSGKHIVIREEKVTVVANSMDEALIQSVLLAHKTKEDFLDYCIFDCALNYASPYFTQQ